MRNRNVTLSLPEEDLQLARVLAARRGTSVSRLLAETLRDLVHADSGYSAAKTHSLDLLAGGADFGTHGRTNWSRDALHER